MSDAPNSTSTDLDKLRRSVAAMVLSAMRRTRSPASYGTSYADNMNEEIAREVAGEILGTAKTAIGETWYRELIDREPDHGQYGSAAQTVQETCIDCGKIDPCDDDCPNFIEPAPPVQDAGKGEAVGLERQIEQILFGRIMRNRLEGYTIETAKEIMGLLDPAYASPERQKIDHPNRPYEADYEYIDLKRRIETLGGPKVVVGILQQYAFAAPRQGSYAGSLWAIAEWLNEQLASSVSSTGGGPAA